MIKAINTNKILAFSSMYIISSYKASIENDKILHKQTIGLELPGMTIDQTSYSRVYPNANLSGVSYSVELVNFSIACESDNFNVSILNQDNINQTNTINEVYKYSFISKNIRFAEKIIYLNRDNPMSNNMYLYIENRDADNSIKNVYVELVYIPLIDRNNIHNK